MKTTKFLLAACILAGFSSSGIAQNVEVKTDTVGKQVRKTVKMEVKSAEDLLKLFGGANLHFDIYLARTKRIWIPGLVPEWDPILLLFHDLLNMTRE